MLREMNRGRATIRNTAAPDEPRRYPAGFLMSAVVAQELIAGATDEAESRRWQAATFAYEAEERLIVPAAEDWLMASKVLFWLGQGRRRRGKGKAPRRQPEAKQRMVLDALMLQRQILRLGVKKFRPR